MSIKAYYKSNKEDELLTMITQEALLSMSRIIKTYLCMTQVYFEGIHNRFLLWCEELYIEYAYDLCLHTKFHDYSQTL